MRSLPSNHKWHAWLNMQQDTSGNSYRVCLQHDSRVRMGIKYTLFQTEMLIFRPCSRLRKAKTIPCWAVLSLYSPYMGVPPSPPGQPGQLFMHYTLAHASNLYQQTDSPTYFDISEWELHVCHSTRQPWSWVELVMPWASTEVRGSSVTQEKKFTKSFNNLEDLKSWMWRGGSWVMTQYFTLPLLKLWCQTGPPRRSCIEQWLPNTRREWWENQNMEIWAIYVSLLKSSLVSLFDSTLQAPCPPSSYFRMEMQTSTPVPRPEFQVEFIYQIIDG